MTATASRLQLPGRLPLRRSLDVTTSAAAAAAANKGAPAPARHFVRCKTPITTGSRSTAVRSRDLHTRGCGFEPRLLLPPLMTLLHDFYDWVWPIRVNVGAGLTLDLEYLTWDCNIQISRVPKLHLQKEGEEEEGCYSSGRSTSITQLRLPDCYQ